MVGAATARALPAHHLVADLIPDDETAEGLVARHGGSAGTMPGPGACCSRGPEGARDVVGPGLRAKGWEVTEVDAYRTVAAGVADGIGEDASSTRRRRADVITFTSPSTVDLLRGAGRTTAPHLLWWRASARSPPRRPAKAGFSVDVVAAEHSVDGLVAALSAHLGAVSCRPPT